MFSAGITREQRGTWHAGKRSRLVFEAAMRILPCSLFSGAWPVNACPVSDVFRLYGLHTPLMQHPMLAFAYRITSSLFPGAPTSPGRLYLYTLGCKVGLVLYTWGHRVWRHVSMSFLSQTAWSIRPHRTVLCFRCETILTYIEDFVPYVFA